jgi:hypothetical protein
MAGKYPNSSGGCCARSRSNRVPQRSCGRLCLDIRCLVGTTLIVNYYNLVYNVELHEIIKNS